MTVAASPRELRTTPLHAAHRRRGARMVEFGGWEMPVQYAGILEEHRAVRTRAGLFDVSHMGEVEIRGPGALAAVQRLLTNDAGALEDGGALYSPMCLPCGGIVDDVIVTRRAAERWLVCVNASNRDKDLAWIREHARAAEVADVSDETALVALQGPLAVEILAPLADRDVGTLPAFRTVEAAVAGVPALVSRTGYTGEDGFEIYAQAGDAERLWTALLAAGEGRGLLPCGLGARDTLRLERALMLYGNDIDETTTPLEAGLAWTVKLEKGDFVGRDALLRQLAGGLAKRLVGLVMDDPSVPRHGYPLLDGGRAAGAVTSGTKSPTLGRGIALGYVAAAAAVRGRPLEVEIRGKRHPARVVGLPFHRRG